MKTELVIGLLFITFTVSGQLSIPYNKLDANKSTKKFIMDSLEIVEEHKLDDYTFYVGWARKKKEVNDGLKLLVKDKNHNIIFISEGQGESYIFRPTFFRPTGKVSPTLIFLEIGYEYSLGNWVYVFDKGKIKKLGLIEIAATSTGDPMTNIADYLEIVDNGEIEIRFISEQITVDPGGPEEEVLPSNAVYFKIFAGKLTKVRK